MNRNATRQPAEGVGRGRVFAFGVRRLDLPRKNIASRDSSATLGFGCKFAVRDESKICDEFPTRFPGFELALV